MSVLVILALLLSLRRVLNVISTLTPFAFALVIVLAGYAALTADPAGVDLEAVAATQEDLASPHWLLSAFLHVSFKDRKSTRLNSSHVAISYAVFCLKKKRQPT